MLSGLGGWLSVTQSSMHFLLARRWRYYLTIHLRLLTVLTCISDPNIGRPTLTLNPAKVAFPL
jgi:hypothetical protein